MALGSPPEQALQLFPEQLLQPALHPVWLSALPRAEEHPLLPGHQDRQLVPLLLQRVVTQEEERHQLPVLMSEEQGMLFSTVQCRKTFRVQRRLQQLLRK